MYAFQKQFEDDKCCIDVLVKLERQNGYSCRYCDYKNIARPKDLEKEDVVHARNQTQQLNIPYLISCV